MIYLLDKGCFQYDMNTAYGDLPRSKTSDKILRDKLLTLFSLWYFDLVFAHGGGGIKLPTPYFISDWRMLYTWDFAHVLSTLCSLRKCKNKIQ